MYVNQKCLHSLDAQCITGSDGEFKNILANCSVSSHGSFIWNNCAIRARLLGNPQKGLLIGDTSYPLEKVLRTKVVAPQINMKFYLIRHAFVWEAVLSIILDF